MRRLAVVWTSLLLALLAGCAAAEPPREARELAASTHRAFRQYREWAEAPERDAAQAGEYARLGAAIDAALEEWEMWLGGMTAAAGEIEEEEARLERLRQLEGR